MTDLPGHWEGDVFHFDYPIEVMPGHPMDRINLSGVDVEDGITKEMLIEALLDPGRQVREVRHAQVVCQGCGRTGTAELDDDLIAKVGGLDKVAELEPLNTLCPDCRPDDTKPPMLLPDDRH